MNVIYAIVTGSHLYGTNIPDSDIDFKGYGLPSISNIIGMNSKDVYEHTNGMDGKNKKEGTIYSFKKFISLCIKSNPNIYEIVFADTKYNLVKNQLSDEINNFIKTNMISQSIYFNYIGMLNGMLFKNKNATLKAYSHTYRLILNCIELLTTKKLTPTLSGKEKQLAFDIRNGMIPVNECWNICVKEYDRLLEIFKKYGQSLNKEIDKELVNSFVVDIHTRYINDTLGVSLTDYNTLICQDGVLYTWEK